MKIYRRLIALGAVLLLAACASTPESRIKKNPELFATFPADAQAKIQKGEVDIGFTPDMVEFAKGKPNRTYSRRTAAGETEVWAYSAYRYSTDRQRVEARGRYIDAGGKYRTYTDWVWVDVQRQTEYDQLRIEFQNGKVSAIETADR
jgi:hypothetical protein